MNLNIYANFCLYATKNPRILILFYILTKNWMIKTVILIFFVQIDGERV